MLTSQVNKSKPRVKKKHLKQDRLLRHEIQGHTFKDVEEFFKK